MICPHCHRTIREEDVYLMSIRVPKDEPLPDWARRLAYVGALVIGFLVMTYVFWLRSHL